MAMHTELWFPTVIWSAMTHKFDNIALKKFAYERKKHDPGRIISNYNGYQSSDLLPGENQVIDQLVNFLDHEVNSCAKQVGLANLEIGNIWININPPGAYNLMHNHVGAVFSGVYYVEAGDNQGNIVFQRTDNAEYHLPKQVAQYTYYTSTQATYKCKTGALYVFPGWLDHHVQSNRSNTDRISISFNYDEK